MNFIFFLLLILVQSLKASPLNKMNQRLSIYNEANSHHCSSSDVSMKQEGLYLDVTCQFNCKAKTMQKERVRGAFVPADRGLFAGNGSTEGNPIWSSVGVSMKSWVQDICLEKALVACKTYQEIENTNFETVESGDWNLHHFPECQEKELTLSPFNNSIKTNRIFNQSPIMKHLVQKDSYILPGLETQIALSPVVIDKADPNYKLKNCKRKIRAQVCYGDCVDLTSKDFIETLATNEPLGQGVMEVCGDQLHSALVKLNPTDSVKKSICDSYFWNSVIHDKDNLYRTCSAIRGVVDCDGLNF